jgi:hypothetical protein
MGSVFWDAEGCVLIELLPQGETITADCYLYMLHKFCHSGEKRIILQHSNTWPRTACLWIIFRRMAGNLDPIHPTVQTYLFLITVYMAL